MSRLPEQERIRRSESLRTITENDDYQAAKLAVRDRIVAEWERTAPAEVEKRERLHLSLKLLDAVTGTIEQHIQTGETDRKRIEELKGRSKLLPFDLW